MRKLEMMKNNGARRRSKRICVAAAAAAIALGALAQRANASGGCCTGGACAIVADAGSCGGFYLGDGTTCTAGVCDVGGCVVNPLNSQSCIDSISQSECLLQEGTWLGAGNSCASVLTNGLYTPPGGGQVNISGATLFNNFFSAAASTNDYLNVDGDDIYCRSPIPNGPVTNTGNPFVGFADTDCNPGIDTTDQLAPSYCPQSSGFWGRWLVQYRGSGSVEGLTEFVNSQLQTSMITRFLPVWDWSIERSGAMPAPLPRTASLQRTAIQAAAPAMTAALRSARTRSTWPSVMFRSVIRSREPAQQPMHDGTRSPPVSVMVSMPILRIPMVD